MKVDPNFNIGQALSAASIPLEVFEPYKQRLGDIMRAKHFGHVVDEAWLKANEEAENSYPEIARLVEMHAAWMAQERTKNSKKEEL